MYVYRDRFVNEALNNLNLIQKWQRFLLTLGQQALYRLVNYFVFYDTSGVLQVFVSERDIHLEKNAWSQRKVL